MYGASSGDDTVAYASEKPVSGVLEARMVPDETVTIEQRWQSEPSMTSVADWQLASRVFSVQVWGKSTEETS